MHHVFRGTHDENISIYQTLFFLGNKTNEEILYLRILVGYLKDYLEKKLNENKINVKKIDISQKLINFNSVLIIQIFLSIEPHMCEQYLDVALMEFDDYMELVSIEEFDLIKKSALSSFELNESQLILMRRKIYENWVLNEQNSLNTDLKTNISNIVKNKFIHFIKSIFTQNIRRLTDEIYSFKLWDSSFKQFKQNKYLNLDNQDYLVIDYEDYIKHYCTESN